MSKSYREILRTLVLSVIGVSEITGADEENIDQALQEMRDEIPVEETCDCKEKGKSDCFGEGYNYLRKLWEEKLR